MKPKVRTILVAGRKDWARSRSTRAAQWVCAGALTLGCSSSTGTTSPDHTQNPVGSAGSGGGAVTPVGNGGAASVGNPSFGGTPGPTGTGASPSTNGGAPPIGTGNAGTPGNPFNTGGAPNPPGGGTGGLGFPAAGGTPNVGGSGAGPGTAGAAGTPVMTGDPSKGCEGETMPAITGDYSANGPLPTKVVNSTGSDGMYTIYRPTTLGANGFKHPVATWGNGITTTPAYYPGLLGAIASHGFVVIASNSSNVTTQLMTDGLDWMVAQNGVAGDYQGKLNPTCLVTIGYSLGGGASVGAGAHANVVATASMHGVTGASNTLHAPLLLLTSETDTFVVPATFVTPTFNMSSVQTFYGTLSMAADTGNAGHLIPVDLLPSTANMLERAAMIAWLRLWVYSDQGAKKYFYGDDCILCKDPWTMPQRKNWQ